MKKFLLMVAAVMVMTTLSVPVAYAAPPSPTQEDVLLMIGEEGVPLGGVQAVPPAEELDMGLVDIKDSDVPLAYVPAPQTGVNDLAGMEALALAAIACTVSGAVILAKPKKQTGSVR